MTLRRLAPALVLLLAACATPKRDFTPFLSANPRSLLVVPVVNNTVEVNAPDYFLSTVPIPVAERGYYVFPVNLVKRMLEDDGLADASLVHGADPTRLAALFGADAVLYIAIERWDAQYVVISTKVTVELTYTIKDGKTGLTLWTEKRRATFTSDSGGGGLVGALVKAAVTKAAPNYMPLARQANLAALGPYGGGFPIGPYRAEYGQDYPHPAKAVATTPVGDPSSDKTPATTNAGSSRPAKSSATKKPAPQKDPAAQ
jgi:hypothetical protein